MTALRTTLVAILATFLALACAHARELQPTTAKDSFQPTEVSTYALVIVLADRVITGSGCYGVEFDLNTNPAPSGIVSADCSHVAILARKPQDVDARNEGAIIRINADVWYRCDLWSVSRSYIAPGTYRTELRAWCADDNEG